MGKPGLEGQGRHTLVIFLPALYNSLDIQYTQVRCMNHKEVNMSIAGL